MHWPDHNIHKQAMSMFIWAHQFIYVTHTTDQIIICIYASHHISHISILDAYSRCIHCTFTCISICSPVHASECTDEWEFGMLGGELDPPTHPPSPWSWTPHAAHSTPWTSFRCSPAPPHMCVLLIVQTYTLASLGLYIRPPYTPNTQFITLLILSTVT